MSGGGTFPGYPGSSSNAPQMPPLGRPPVPPSTETATVTEPLPFARPEAEQPAAPAASDGAAPAVGAKLGAPADDGLCHLGAPVHHRPIENDRLVDDGARLYDGPGADPRPGAAAPPVNDRGVVGGMGHRRAQRRPPAQDGIVRLQPQLWRADAQP